MRAKLTLSWRIGQPGWEQEESFERLAAMLVRRRAIVDEVALFDSITHHLYIPEDEYARRMDVARRRMAELRRAGARSVGVNVLCTIGHINEGWSYMPPLPFQAMVGHDGGVSTGCACPNTPEMRAYIRAKYCMAAGARPDFIWVDDDIRMHNHGVAWGCFCPTCLEIFSSRAGKKYGREELARAFDDPAQGELRRLWIEHNIETIESLLLDVAAAVREVDANIALGLMTGGPSWTTYSGFALKRWFKALGAVKSRPGGGFYSDAVPGDMYYKALECGWQRAALPPSATDVQYELENFPYQILKKSAVAAANECALALAYGLNGVAFNALGMSAPGRRGYEDAAPLFRKITAARPLWEKLVGRAAGLPTAGLWIAWKSDLMACRSVRPGETWLSRPPQYDFSRARVLAEIGLPIAVDTPGCGTVLCGRVAEAFSDAELKRILSRGVIMDSEALNVLTERGLGHFSGVRITERLDNGVLERFTDEEMNGDSAGVARDARIEFWGDARGMADVLAPVADGVRVLAEMEDYFNRRRGPCMTAFENSLGGRVVVMGYAPWIFLHSAAKRRQLQNAADWISRGGLPVRIEQPVRLIPVVRMSPDRKRGVVVLLNAGMDPVKSVEIRIRAAPGKARLLSGGRRDSRLKAIQMESGWGVELRGVPPWSLRVLEFEAC